MAAKRTRKKSIPAPAPEAAPAAPVGDLREEIALLRENFHAVQARSSAGEISLEEMLKVLDVLSRSAARLAKLLEAQRSLDEAVGMPEAFSRAFEEALREQGLE